jgi:hypothetical protein
MCPSDEQVEVFYVEQHKAIQPFREVGVREKWSNGVMAGKKTILRYSTPALPWLVFADAWF